MCPSIFASGAIDVRVKFIYISREELEVMAEYIKQQGRISITELVASSIFLTTPRISITSWVLVGVNARGAGDDKPFTQ